MSDHTPRKRFGQNFLHDQGVIRRIAQAIRPQPGQHLVEIGPGKGALTTALLEYVPELDAVELDRDLVPLLQAQLGDRVHIHNQDALRFDFCSLAQAGERLRVVGNLPYNISTPLLFHLMEQRHCIQDMHFMLQKEVVERMAAGPGGRDYGRLSIMLQYYCQVERLFTVPPGAFFPAPKVDSAIVRLIPHATPPVALDSVEALGRLVAQAFSQRRKTLRNTMKGLLDEAAIQACGVDPQLRPEQIGLADYACLANRLYQTETLSDS